MKKDIFEEGYFSKHRDNSNWNNLNKKSISRVLNVKQKPKIDNPIQEPAPKPVQKKEKNSYDILDKEYRTQNKQNGRWKSEYIKAVISGFCGGIIVLLVLTISNYEGNYLSLEGAINSVTLLFLAMIFLIFFAGIFHFLGQEA